MALEATVKYAIKRIAQALADYARNHGWGPDDYQVWVRLNLMWGRIHLLIVAKTFPRTPDKDARTLVWEFLEDKLRDDPPLLSALNLVVRTFDQVNEGGIYAISPRYMEINDLLVSGPVEDLDERSPFAS